MVLLRRALLLRVWAMIAAVAGLAASVSSARAEIPSPSPDDTLASAAASSAWESPEIVTVEAPVQAGGYFGEDDCLEPGQRWYVSLSGAAQSRHIVHEVGDPATFLIFDDGFALNAALGHQFNLFRMDFEYSLFNNQVETAGAGIPGVGNFVGDAVGNVSVKAYTLNGYYDFDYFRSCFRPYVGAGMGVMQSEINSLFPSFFPGLGAATGGVNTTSNFKLCYQFRVGIGYTLSHRTELFSGYRYFDAGPLTFAGEPFGVFQPDGATFHSFEMGFRVKF